MNTTPMTTTSSPTHQKPPSSSFNNDQPVAVDRMDDTATTRLVGDKNENRNNMDGSSHRNTAIQITPPPPPTTTTTTLASLPENRFELELEFIQALSSPAYIHFLATTSRTTLDDANAVSSSNVASQQSTFQQLQPFLHYLYNTYSQPEYARFLRYPHALYFLESLLIYDDDDDDEDDTNPKKDDMATAHATDRSGGTTTTTTNANTTTTTTTTNPLWVEWTVPSYRNFCHQQQFLAWQHRHATCYGVGGTAMNVHGPAMNTTTTNDENHPVFDNINPEKVGPAATPTTVDENDDMDDDDDEKQE